MIKNELTYKEIEKIIRPILKLENILTIKESIYKVLHFTRANPSDKEQYIISSNFTGISSTYRGFEIEVRNLNDRDNDYIDVLLRLVRKKTFKDHFFSSKNKIVKEIKNFCETEISECWFSNFDPGGIIKDDTKEEFLYQLGAKNPEWKKQNKISPLTIFIQEKSDQILIEFLFSPDCYERIENKTSLKENWLEIFTKYCPSW